MIKSIFHTFLQMPCEIYLDHISTYVNDKIYWVSVKRWFYCLRVEVCFPDVVVDSEGWERGPGCVFSIKRNWPGNFQCCIIQGETSGCSAPPSKSQVRCKKKLTFWLPAVSGLIIIEEGVVIVTQTVAEVGTFPDILRLALMMVVIKPVTLGNLRTKTEEVFYY